MSVQSILEIGRRQTESRMTELVGFYGLFVEEDPVSGQPLTGENKLSGLVPARLRVSVSEPRDAEVAGQLPVVDRLEIHVPVGSADFGPDVMIIVVSSSVDEGIVGKRFRIRSAPTKGQVTAWRYPVELVQ